MDACSPDEPLLGDRQVDDPSNTNNDAGDITHSDKPRVDAARMAQLEAYLAEKKQRKAARRFKRMLEAADSREAAVGQHRALGSLRGPPTDVGSIASSTYSCSTTNSPHDADSGSAFSLTEDDMAALKELQRKKKLQKRASKQNLRQPETLME
ncbi:hypothetical protein E3P99_01251 [Wallemia hederae]|uniref:Uncharacterized protein n=1 Tax=Wallemia hederae TaxID=1540922 RepID=A0A4T0FRC5_9BASI|nr:hypothetical protein E3P99_01251 [Wallemia hederae]